MSSFDEDIDKLIHDSECMDELIKYFGLSSKDWARQKLLPKLAVIRVRKMLLDMEELKVEIEIEKLKRKRRK